MLEELKIELERLAATRNIGQAVVAQSRADGFIEIKGKRLVDFANWDFLSINGAQRAKVIRAAQSTIERSGIGSRSARLYSGLTPEHVSCEKRLGRFLRTEDALLFSSKNQAFFSLFSSLLNERDAVVVEETVQGPVADVAYLLNASASTFSTVKGSSLGAELEKLKVARRKFVIVESISSITGVEIDIPALVGLCAKFDANLIVDMSTTLGIRGIRGEGPLGDIPLPPFGVIGDLGLSLGIFGGFLAGPKILCRYVEASSRSFAFEPTLPAAIAAGIESALELIELAHGPRESLQQRAKMLQNELLRLRIPTSNSVDSPIASIPFPKLSKALVMSRALYDRGYYVEAVERRTEHDETTYLRILVNLHHTEKQIQDFALTIAELLPRVVAG